MKKGVLILILFSIFLVSFVIAAEGDEETIEKSIDDKAYDCLNDRFNQTGCSGLSTEGKIFALLTLGECKDEILADANYKSNIKLTSQAILALNKVGVDTSDPIDWLWKQNKTSKDMTWFLQIDSSEATICSITYGSSTNTINIGVDKKIDTNAGNCLTRATENYWLQINSACYDEEFEITCDKDFLTTLLFKSSDNTIHVSPKSTSSQGGGTTIEKIEFLCFQKGNSCDYEGTLWAALILNYIGTDQDLNKINFYLTTLSSISPQYLPSSFLYSLIGTNEFENELIQSQSPAGFWKVGNNKYYDTALALLSIPSGSTNWENALTWLEDEQMATGCWNSNNFADTAFTVYSVWPRGVSLSAGVSEEEIIPTTEGESCSEVGYFCMSGVNCEGSILDEYDCNGFDKCCNQDQTLETCSDLNGDICNSNQQCAGGDSENTFDLDYGQTCCIGGACEEKIVTEEFTCSSNGGICRIEGCEGNEESSFETCEFGDTCCVEKTSTGEANYLWVWILIILILIGLVVLGIVKRDKLREYWFRLKSKFKKNPPLSPGINRPLGRPGYSSQQRRPMQGMSSPSQRPLIRRPSRIARPSSKAPNEINDVLKKLKDMGK